MNTCQASEVVYCCSCGGRADRAAALPERGRPRRRWRARGCAGRERPGRPRRPTRGYTVPGLSRSRRAFLHLRRDLSGGGEAAARADVADTARKARRLRLIRRIIFTPVPPLGPVPTFGPLGEAGGTRTGTSLKAASPNHRRSSTGVDVLASSSPWRVTAWCGYTENGEWAGADGRRCAGARRGPRGSSRCIGDSRGKAAVSCEGGACRDQGKAGSPPTRRAVRVIVLTFLASVIASQA